MEYRKFNDKYVVRLDKEEEVIDKITELCKLENITLGTVSALGATDYIKIGLYDVNAKEYISTIMEEPMEITSLIGNISTMNNEIYLHLHINVSDRNMNVKGGHLNECRISATCEIIISKIDGNIDRVKAEEIGLNLYKF